MQKLSICVGQGQKQGVGARGWGQGGVWNSSQVTAADILLWVGMGEVGVRQWWGWEGWWGRGVGRGFNQSFEQNRYRYIELLSACTLRDKIGRKSRFRGGFPIFGRESPCYDITFSKIRHNLAQKKSENEKARDFTSLSMQEGAAILEIWKLAHLRISNLIYEAMAAYFS